VKLTLPLAIVSAFFIALPLTANAADMAIKTSAPPPPPSFNWTGCYFGGNAGVARTNYSATLETVAAAPLLTPLNTAAGNAAAYGGQVGCDYQPNGSSWVVGLRGMWDGTTIKTNSQGGTPVGAVIATSALNSKATAFGTAVARVGYSLTPALMFYGTGGVAFAANKYSQTFQIPPGATFQFNGNDTPVGWTAGVGASWMLNQNWDFFVEYNYLGFANRTVTTTGVGPIANNVRQDVQTILAGIDFRFTNWAGGQFGLR
jgi:outer membrane immunogenic protein